jgi:hypothetical protein
VATHAGWTHVGLKAPAGTFPAAALELFADDDFEPSRLGGSPD